jgi:hypothetical protein
MMMYTRKEQIEIIKSIPLKENSRLSMDCPFCYGKKKFSITNLDGRILWNCYRASCGCKGTFVVSRSVQACENKLKGYVPKIKTNEIPIPTILSDPNNHDIAINYLKKVNSFDAYEKKLCEIKYCPSDNRVLFFNKHKTGAVGRSLDNRKPKWKTYRNCTGIFEVGTSKDDFCIVVEDVPSACSIARLPNVVGVSILGTNVSSLQRLLLSQYKRVVVALDKDASKKAIAMRDKIMTDATVLLLEKDLKLMSLEELEVLI